MQGQDDMDENTLTYISPQFHLFRFERRVDEMYYYFYRYILYI